MENKQLLPFERNRYYTGKMLTSADFQAEQDYFNNKRRFLNSMMYGAGIACGYSVYGLDDQSILIESGMAIDAHGREIVIEKSIVKKLSAIDGFEQLQSDEAVLCIRYAEEKVHSVYAIGKSEREETEFNRINEGYELFLIDASEDVSRNVEADFLTTGILFINDDYKITMAMPSTVCKGQMVKVTVCAMKLSEENKSLSYTGVFQIPAFFNEDNSHEILVEFEQLLLQKGESVSREFWLKVLQTEQTDADIVLKKGTAAVRLGANYAEAVYPFTMKVRLSQRHPRYLVSEAIGKVSLEMHSMNSQNAWVELAHIKVSREQHTYLIENINENQIKQYILSPANEMLRMEYMDYYKTEEKEYKANIQKLPAQDENHNMHQKYAGIEIATGTLEIPLGDHVRRGDIRYSGEIMHGLGKGNVYVEIGYEYIAEDIVVGANTKSTIYGNQSLFQSENENFSQIETAVKVLNDKGSFVVAAKLS